MGKEQFDQDKSDTGLRYHPDLTNPGLTGKFMIIDLTNPGLTGEVYIQRQWINMVTQNDKNNQINLTGYDQQLHVEFPLTDRGFKM